MLKILTAAVIVVGTNAIDLTADTTKLCSETESGACHCENGNQIDEVPKRTQTSNIAFSISKVTNFQKFADPPVPAYVD